MSETGKTEVLEPQQQPGAWYTDRWPSSVMKVYENKATGAIVVDHGLGQCQCTCGCTNAANVKRFPFCYSGCDEYGKDESLHRLRQDLPFWKFMSSLSELGFVAATNREIENKGKSDMNIKKFLTIVELIPSVIQLVKTAETAITGSGKGPSKLNLVLNAVDAAVSVVPEVDLAFESGELASAVSKVVTGVVATMNAAGEFKKEG